MTARWTVKFVDRSETVVEITPTDNPGRDEHAAMHQAERATVGRVAFAGRPEGCTGFAWNVHFGAENACPVHGEKVEK